ncbi:MULTISPECIES: hypothetical protein [unclassified Rhodococcus (in: high G+C Gram-positive bacteria)]|uniref:hypothetical protein n=1 Tax=unclassified Rhodococcus (in: high G+C Gram-positive bacteria) TaxID=192944 RepID=UPI00117A5235|nr:MULTISPECIES: hypothetical protein [unclassified Rhodococcus (in: high G+C Gram-positive bacteria)]
MAIAISVAVKGRDQLITKLAKFRASVRQFNSAFDRIGAFMFDNAINEAPEFTGALKGSHRLKSTAMQASVSAGGPGRTSHGGGIYVAAQHNGGFARGSYGPHKVGPNPWLDRALMQSTPRAIAIIEEEVGIKIKLAGL